MRVLVVDDHVDAAETTKRVLVLMGFRAISAHSGEVALKPVAEFQPDVIFLDLVMPGLDGFRVAERLRGNHAVLIALTGLGHEDVRRRTAEAGFAYHLVKPVDPDLLLTLLDRIAPD